MNRWWFAGAMVAALAVGSVVGAERSAANMSSAATKFVASLSPEQRQKATFAFDTEERRHWHFIPTEMFPRQGLLLRDMNDAQRKLAHDLMKSALSQRGYMTASSIMELEKVLGAIEAAQRSANQIGRASCRERVKTSV